uniref:Uncharacterized protein n=1 Tax=Magnetococcus massalia (strain MO-1) TaxID=451514 RepID=A0A1S7LGG6_MAGMO|nr:protein of unknown function [Candidatus Magnetococcus massalia]
MGPSRILLHQLLHDKSCQGQAKK